MNQTRRRWLGLVLVLLVCMIGFSSPVLHFVSFPRELRLFDGQPRELRYSMPVHADVSVNPALLRVNGSTSGSQRIDLQHPLSLQPHRSGQTELKLKLFGRIPFKTVKVNIVPDLKVIPGGQTIGVKVKSDGIMVVGLHKVDGGERAVSPGEHSGIRTGDVIARIDGTSVGEVSKVAKLVEQAGKEGKPLRLSIRRNGKWIERTVVPVYDKEDGAWRLGLYIRDSAAGVGTLTFYAPDQGVYGALGHVITDMDTQQPIDVGSGEILQSSVTSINKSESGEPGEKRAQFLRHGETLGNVERNTAFGIFGKMSKLPAPSYSSDPVHVAFAEEVKEGPAQILTVLGGQKVERFSIEIAHVSKQTSPATKGMVIRITDPRLLQKTGGIVQGMSGSPILQNGKLVGAVTHVFVNDPSTGYGCFIEWMLQDAGILLNPEVGNSKAG